MAGLKAVLEPRWKKIFKKRVKKTGMSANLRAIDAGMVKEYVGAGGAKGFIKRVGNPKTAASDDARFLKGFQDNKKKIKKIIDGKKDWTSDEKKFFTAIMSEFDDEIKFWKGKPLTKEFKD